MLKYYALPLITGEGWAHIALNTETSFFAAVSCWGNYAFIRDVVGTEFRQHLIQLQPAYLYGKLMMDRTDREVLDGTKTKAGIIKAIEELNKERRGWRLYKEELALVAAHSFADESDFEAWQSETRISEPWEYVERGPSPVCMDFCTKLWPRFVKLLRKELEEERKAGEEAVALKAAKPAIIAAVAADIVAMTGADVTAQSLKITKGYMQKAIKGLLLMRDSGMPEDGIVALLSYWVVGHLKNKTEVVDD
jgi:hypothetical protein